MNNRVKTKLILFIPPFVVWVVIGTVVFLMSEYMLVGDFSICEFDETNYHSDDYTSPYEEHKECLKAYDGLRYMFSVGAVFLGFVFGIVRVYAFSDHTKPTQK